jgi:AcrR family transcriptional regulator
MILKDTILNAAVTIARNYGLRGLTRQTVADASACAVGTVNYHFETMDALRDAVVDFAVANEVIEVLAQARAERHPRLKGRLTPALKERVAAHIAGN